VTRNRADRLDRTALQVARGPHQSGAGPRRERGQILVLFTIAIVVIMLFASIVVDLGLLRNNHQILVNAADAATLAGGEYMPVDGCSAPTPQSATMPCTTVNNVAVAKVTNVITSTLQAGYPGIQASDYTIAYRCLIGVDNSTPPQPYISRDVPVVCNPRNALGHTAVAADFKGAGPTRWSICRPDLGDKCNVVYLTAATTTNYSFGRVVGVNSGSSGTVASAACNGPCGQPPAAPVDLVMIIDRTGSMLTPTDLTQKTKDAARAVLGVYDPALQRVALGLLGPSKPTSTCSGAGGGPAVGVNVGTNFTTAAPSTGTGSSWIQSANTASTGATFLNIPKPTTLNNSDVLVAAVSFSGGTTNNITPPAGWTPIDRTDTPTATNMSMQTYYKVISNAGGEPANYTFSFTLASNGTAATIRAAGGLIRYSGVNIAAVLDVNGEQSGTDTTNPFQPTAPDVNQTTIEGAVIGFFAMNNNTTFSANSNGLTERFDRNTGGASPSIQGANKIDSTAGPTAASSATAGAGGEYAAQQIVLKPTPPDPYGSNPGTDLALWIPIGFTSTDTDTPAPAWNEAYSDTNGNPIATSHLVSGINCHDAGGSTNLATPLAMATYYLQNFGRPNSVWGILLETDGQPSYSGTGAIADYTCGQAAANAAAAKALTNADGKHVEIFTVGYGLDTPSGQPTNNALCPDGRTVGGYTYPTITGYNYVNKYVTKALSNIATQPDLAPIPPANGSTTDCVPAENADQDHFFCEPKTTDLTTVFKTIAVQLAGIRSHLVQVDPLPMVYSIAPTIGSHLGGTTVTITGKFFTGTTGAGGVKFGGTNATSYTVVSDTRITATAPPGATGATVDIIVTTNAGSSPANNGDRFTFT
jgi:hypothetical protein